MNLEHRTANRFYPSPSASNHYQRSPESLRPRSLHVHCLQLSMWTEASKETRFVRRGYPAGEPMFARRPSGRPAEPGPRGKSIVSMTAATPLGRKSSHVGRERRCRVAPPKKRFGPTRCKLAPQRDDRPEGRADGAVALSLSVQTLTKRPKQSKPRVSRRGRRASLGCLVRERVWRPIRHW